MYCRLYGYLVSSLKVGLIFMMAQLAREYRFTVMEERVLWPVYWVNREEQRENIIVSLRHLIKNLLSARC